MVANSEHRPVHEQGTDNSTTFKQKQAGIK